MYTIGQFAKKTGVTIRTLHYYDEIGLLPAIIADNGRRFYTDDHIHIIQTILVCKYLDYSLDDIKSMLANETPLIQSLHEQKLQLEEKRKQLDQMIASMDVAIAIHEKENVIEPTSLLVVIHSLLTVEEQKNHLREFLSDKLVEKIYDFLGDNFVELNRQYIKTSYSIKEAYCESLPDDELRQRIMTYLNIIPAELSAMMLEELMEKDVSDIDRWLFTSLFTDEEELWLEEQMTRLRIREEFIDEGTNTTAMDTH